jgi:hypothetical protein
MSIFLPSGFLHTHFLSIIVGVQKLKLSTKETFNVLHDRCGVEVKNIVVTPSQVPSAARPSGIECCLCSACISRLSARALFLGGHLHQGDNAVLIGVARHTSHL